MNNDNLYSEIFKEFKPSSYGTALLWKTEKFEKYELSIEDWDKFEKAVANKTFLLYCKKCKRMREHKRISVVDEDYTHGICYYYCDICGKES